MLVKWICSASVKLWAQIFWFVVFQNCCLLLGIVLTVAGCSGKICRRKKNKTDPSKKKTGRTGTMSGSTTSGTTTGTRTSIPNHEISAAAGVFGSETPETKVTTTTTEGDTKTADAGQEKNGKGAGGGKSKGKKKKKKTEDADEGNKKTAEVEEKKAETQEFNHENTLRIEMCDDDHTKTRTFDASACMDAYDTNNPTPEENQVKLEKKQSQHGKKNKSVKKGKGKKKKDTTVQSVDCAAAADDKEKDKITNSKKSKKSKRSLRGPQPNSLNNDKAQQKSGPEEKKLQTMIEGEETPQKEKKDASLKK